MAVLPILPLEQGLDRVYTKIRMELERKGTPIGPNDLFIAAHALQLDACLVTTNLEEFQRVPRLKALNWLV